MRSKGEMDLIARGCRELDELTTVRCGWSLLTSAAVAVHFASDCSKAVRGFHLCMSRRCLRMLVSVPTRLSVSMLGGCVAKCIAANEAEASRRIFADVSDGAVMLHTTKFCTSSCPNVLSRQMYA